MPFASHEEYLTTVPPEQQARLLSIRAEIERLVPDAKRCISYNLPAFKAERIFIYFAAFKHHIGIYPPVTSDRALIEETAQYRGPKGNLSFPNNQELPLALVRRVIVALASQYSVK